MDCYGSDGEFIGLSDRGTGLGVEGCRVDTLGSVVVIWGRFKFIGCDNGIEIRLADRLCGFGVIRCSGVVGDDVGGGDGDSGIGVGEQYCDGDDDDSDFGWRGTSDGT